MPMDGAREKCGVFAVVSAGEPVASTICVGLIALQHRGQEAAGVAVVDRSAIQLLCGPGLVSEALDPDAVAAMNGSCGIGHVRYSTAGSAGEENSQPVRRRTRTGQEFALAHNGNILSIDGLSTSTTPSVGWGRKRTGSSDTHILAGKLADHRDRSIDEALDAVLPTVVGAFSLVIVSGDTIYCARDRQGFRPLCLGRLGAGWIVASESAALDSVGAQFVREIAPGEILTVRMNGLKSRQFAGEDPATCVFEHIYFSRQDSQLGGRRVQQVRRAMGAALADEAPAIGDVVMPVPETARPAAAGYAERSGIRYEEGLVRNPYVGRTFIKPDNEQRRLGIQLKINPIPEIVRDRRVVVVDDSIVRANSALAVIAMLRAAGAAEVHMRISSPPIRWPCFFGVDLSRPGEIAASDRSVLEMRDLIGADSLGYLSLDAVERAVGTAGICSGCFTGEYPVDIDQIHAKMRMRAAA
ncbi:MAG: amidophosphoribosyltransferase [Pseudonocardiales bacterium]|nr:MAG: amidophosphoribosyltransferase [Pseudonocardiales bacterium]